MGMGSCKGAVGRAKEARWMERAEGGDDRRTQTKAR